MVERYLFKKSKKVISNILILINNRKKSFKGLMIEKSAMIMFQ
jgi:hypothetical protein